MKRKLYFVNDKNETQRGIQLMDGRIISLYNENNNFYLSYDKELNLEDGTFDDATCVGFNDNKTCLNRLLRDGKAIEVSCVDEVTYFEDKYPNRFRFTDAKVRKIQNFFKTKGYNVKEEAIRHQLSLWKDGFKCGYRDDDNGYFLFTPCGLNPLSIRLTPLHKLCEDWQHTYFC